MLKFNEADKTTQVALGVTAFALLLMIARAGFQFGQWMAHVR